MMLTNAALFKGEINGLSKSRGLFFPKKDLKNKVIFYHV